MSVEYISSVLKNSRNSGLNKFVLVCLANYADEKGFAYPSVKTLSDRCGIAESSVHKCMKALLESKEIELVEIGGTVLGQKKSNRYQLHIPRDPYVRIPGKRKDPETNVLPAETGAYLGPVRTTDRSVPSTGPHLGPVRNTEQTGTRHVPDRVRNTDPIRHLDPSINRQSKEPPPSPKGEADAVIPLLLQTPEFLPVWESLKKDRKARGKKMTQKSQELSLEKCLRMGVDRAIAAIKHSIASGYQGVYEEKGSSIPAPSPSSTSPQTPASWTPPTKGEVIKYAVSRRWTASFGIAFFNEMVANNWKNYGIAVQGEDQWKSMMASKEWKP